ncbi:hypothetical protein ACGFIV_32535 [Sphaerisporangium sp. NPDC049003]|uniref:hypothetical protein n=1 Tax=Sphaerisporangium sp. NPDC049003 TaxID=3364517 RepID=UPI00371ECE85
MTKTGDAAPACPEQCPACGHALPAPDGAYIHKDSRDYMCGFQWDPQQPGRYYAQGPEGGVEVIQGLPWVARDMCNYGQQVAPLEPHPDDVPARGGHDGQRTLPWYINGKLAYFPGEASAQRWVDEHNLTSRTGAA